MLVADWTGALQSNKSSDLPASASNPSPRLLDAPPPRPLPDPNPALPLPALELVQPTHDYTVVVYSVILIFGFFSNLYIVLRFLQLRFGLRLNLGAGKDTGLSSAAVLLQHRARLRLLHVALANLLICTISVPMELGWRATIEWRAGNLGCKLLQFGRVLGLYALANCLTAIALDKLLHVRLLLRGTAALGATASGGGWALGSPIHGLLAAGWILSALCSFPQVLVFQAGYSLYSNKVIQCVGMEGFASLGHEHLYNIFMLTGMFLLPAITMLAAYAYIFKHVNSTSDIPDDLESSINQNGAKEETSSLDPQQRARVFSAGGQSRVSAYSHILSLHSGGTGSAAGSGVSSEMELLGGAGAPGTLQVRGADGVYIILDEAFQRDLRVFLAMSLTFICTSLPYVAFTLWYLVDAHSHALIHPIVQELPFVLVLTNTLLIPAIYALRLCAQTT
ncbi:adipokinetic hormone/corazonin-related peptide receptor variant I-like isoform X2 [Paramacrobiotus metropolitanus]|uniref:adipokinetic hormone/corazonin-related peptide receptor variant I-like isoform X2 n=1 Tax=Paramacrobiotus metropolitanus TaxID=2943436 RepID=UPI0024460EA5|nr:adipokinetic hormone/corazonin-related peptide receptor variant I-like isoform X2 [Paramacrobiotus metropolitanus]